MIKYSYMYDLDTVLYNQTLRHFFQQALQDWHFMFNKIEE